MFADECGVCIELCKCSISTCTFPKIRPTRWNQPCS